MLRRGISHSLIVVVVIASAITVTAGGLYYIQSQPKTEKPDLQAELQANGHVHFLYVDKENPNLMLMGTHEGLRRSNDGGKTWATVEVKGEVRSKDFMSIAVDNSKDSKVLYAAGHDMFVTKSSDQGVTWSLSNKGLPNGDVHAIAIAANDPNTLYAWVVSAGLYRSKNGGESWQRMDDGPPNSNVLALASVNTLTGMGGIYLMAGTADGLYATADCFCGWQKVTSFFDSKTIYALAVDPTDPKVILASTRDGIYRSKDAGASWEKIGKGFDNNVQIAALTFDPTDPSSLYAAGVTGAVYRSTDSGNSWVQLREGE
ncbi:MAG TPA: YCF48-related protein [Nitrososphaerales archaeon]